MPVEVTWKKVLLAVFAAMMLATVLTGRFGSLLGAFLLPGYMVKAGEVGTAPGGGGGGGGGSLPVTGLPFV